MEEIGKRLRSKTYWTAIIGSILTIVEANYSILGTLLPPTYQSFTPLLFPVAMVFLREMTTGPISEK